MMCLLPRPTDFPLDEITFYFANNVIHLAERVLSNARPALASALARFLLFHHTPVRGSCRIDPTVRLQEETRLSLGEFHGCGAFLVVIGHVIDPSAYGIAPHQLGIIGLQHVGHRTRIVHSRIEPQVVAIRIENDRHAVMDG